MFEWDHAKAARNLEKHGVSFAEAASVFEDVHAFDLADDEHSRIEPRSWRIGISEEGRVLTVVYTTRRSENDETVRIISARLASRKERQAVTQGKD